MSMWTVHWRCEGYVDCIEADTREQALAEAARQYKNGLAVGQLLVDGDAEPAEFYWAEKEAD